MKLTNPILSFISLVCLTSLFVMTFPFAEAMAFALPSRLWWSIFSPSGLIADYHGEFSLTQARLLEWLGFFWLGGYFLAILVSFALWFPLVPRSSMRLWLGLGFYYAVILLTQPWSRKVWGSNFSPWFQSVCGGLCGVLFLAALVGAAVDYFTIRSERPTASTLPQSGKEAEGAEN